MDAKALETEAQSAIAGAASPDELEEARVRYLGRKSELKQALREVRDRESGMTLNALRERLEAAFAEREEALRGAELERMLGEVSVRSSRLSSKKKDARCERAGCHGSKASLSKLNSTVSTSRSSRTS